MGSYIQIDSISIDLSDSIDKNDADKCEHFSIRGYASEIRKKDWKIGWPFPVDESEEQPSLPQLDVPKFRWWCCQNCQQETAAEGIDNDDRTDINCCSTGCRSDSNCSNAALRSGIQEASMPNTLKRIEIDLNKSTDLSSGSDCLPISNEIEKKAGVVLSTDHEIGLENNLNHEVTSVPLPKVYPGLIQEVHTINKRGCQGIEVSNVELATCNLKCMDKSSAEIYNEGTPISADDQCQKELRKACTIFGEGTTVTKADNITDHTTGHLPPEPVACNLAVPAESTDNMVENNFQDHHLEKSTGLSRRRPRKMRLLTDLLSENGEPKTEQITIQGSAPHCPSNASAASQTLSIFPGKGDGLGDLALTNKGRSRKRKFLLDEEWRPADMCFKRVENEVQSLEGDNKTIDAVLDTRYKDVLVGVGLQDAKKGYQSKPEIERSHIMGKKKNKKIQDVDNHLISEPQQGQQRENVDTMDVANKAYASKTLSSGLFPRAFTEKGMHNFPFHALRTENECDFSKGKGKMLLTDGEPDSLSCWKNNMLVGDSFAHTGEKVMSNMPVSIPIPSAQGALNGKGLEEGLHLSLNSYLPAQVYNKKSIHQIENRLPFTLPLQEGTSKVDQLIRKDSETNFFGEPSISSKHITNAISGKGVRLEEITGERDTVKTAKAVEQGGKRYCDLTAEEVSEQGSMDDVPMDVVELMAMNQYERSLPDAENINGLLEKSISRRKAQIIPGTAGNHLGKNNLSPFGFEVSQSRKNPSSGFHFLHMGSNGSIAVRGSSDATLQAQGGGSLRKTIRQQDDETARIWASLTTNNASLGYDGVPKKVVSQPASSKMDMISLRSGALHKQHMTRDIEPYQNLNRNMGPGTFSRMNAETQFPCKHNGIESHQNMRGSLDLYSNETIPAMHLLSLMDAGKQSGTPFNVGVSAQMLKRPSYPGDCNTKLEIGTSKAHGSLKRQSSDYYSKSYLSDKSRDYFLGSPIFGASSSIQHDEKFISPTDFSDQNSTKSGKREKMNSSNSAMQNRDSKQFSWPLLETETPLQHKLEVHGTHETSEPLKSISGISCMVNRNPADFTIPETGNAYMIRGEDLKFEKSIPQNRPGLPTPRGCKQKRNLKGTKMKEHEKH